MAKINCEECGDVISNEAFVCPKCGFRRFKPSELDKQARRNDAAIEVTRDWAKPIDNLLRDIQEESLDKTRPESETVSRTLARFAALQARISRDDSVTADKNLKIQKGALAIAIVAAVLSTFAFFYQLVRDFKHPEENENSVEIKYHRTYKNQELKEFEATHSATNR